MCINGNHVYAEETDPHSGSTLSLNSSGQGSVEDVRKHTSEVPVDVFISAPVPSHKHESTDRAILEQQRHPEGEERRLSLAKRLEEEEKYRVEGKRLQEEEERRHQEEQERKRRFLEDEAKRKKQREEEEEAAEHQKLEEERRRSEELKQQEEGSMSDRLSSLFGMIRKKEEKKEELPTTAPSSNPGDPDKLISQPSSSTFEDIDIGSERPADHQKSSSKPQTPSAIGGFLNRTAKVSAVKPR